MMKKWIEAMRLRTLPVSVAGVIAGCGCAIWQGSFKIVPAFLSIQGICTRPQTGSQVRPRKCSIPIAAAYSICIGVPPNSWVDAPAAIQQAEPISPWQPTSAPEMEAFVFIIVPISPAVASPLRIFFCENP